MKIRLNGRFLLISCVFLLAGCHKLEATTRINPDGSGELQTGVGFSAEERANLEKQYNNSQDFCNTAQAPANVTMTEEKRGEETWCINTTSFKNLDELRALYQQRTGITINQLEVKDGNFYYDVDIDTLSEDSSFSNLTELTWTVVMPGTPLTHNADEANGNTLTWKPAPKSGIVNLKAESEAPRGFSFPQCGATLAIFGVLFLQVRRHKKTSEVFETSEV
ncbi:MAG: hypothetical protein DCC56_00525 [Anaerolineae bacterium]|nr:MAG: hypothetical protein DCC56_00525 [Anaerolineae bacterium]WKZ44518.1 MAG: hypothetical protein QY302_01855 [Anaerolineales bacterium]